MFRNGKMKAVTFSYDDGVTQDIRLVEILDYYGLKATFNINSGLLGTDGYLERGGVEVTHRKIKPDQVARIYCNHEVAAHTLTHPMLPELPEEEIIRQVNGDVLALESLVGYDIVGMAYPGGGVNHDARVQKIIKENTKIKYARTITSTYSFDRQSDLLCFNPTVYHIMESQQLFALGEEFVRLEPDEPKLFYIWGHSYEFDIAGTWKQFEDFCKLISGKNDIFYGTNRQTLL
ncbi:MAG TPA: polysaccharide deacetylase family protein [Bacillota bacterium]|nr:polysaccharide deacetylase family protein [Bacillota bacterium]